jgi:hypothetical protein
MMLTSRLTLIIFGFFYRPPCRLVVHRISFFSFFPKMECCHFQIGSARNSGTFELVSIGADFTALPDMPKLHSAVIILDDLLRLVVCLYRFAVLRTSTLVGLVVLHSAKFLSTLTYEPQQAINNVRSKYSRTGVLE